MAFVVLVLATVHTAGFDFLRAPSTAVFSGERTTDVLPNEPAQPTGTAGAVAVPSGTGNTGVLSIVAILQITPVLVFETWWAVARKRVRKGDSHRAGANPLTDHPFGV